MPITFGSADLDPIIMFSQPSITVQKELKVPKDQDVCLSAVRGSAQPGIRQVRESHLQACLQQPLSISSSAHPLHHGSVATSHFFWHSYLQAHRDGKYSSTLLFWLFFGLFLVLFCFLAISISVPIPHTVLRTDEAADLRSQWVLTKPWLRAKETWAANSSPATGQYIYVCSSFPLHSCWKAFPLPFELSERGRGAKLTAVLLSWWGWNRLFLEVMNEDD